jgi:ribonuclease Y
MNNISLLVIAGIFLLGAVSTLVIGWYVSILFGTNKIVKAKDKANEILENAEKESKNLKREKELEIKDEWIKLKQQLERETKIKRLEIERIEKNLSLKENNIDRKADFLSKKEREITAYENDLKERDKHLTERRKRLDQLIEEQNIQLEKIAQLTSEEAKRILMNNLLEKAKLEAAKTIKEVKEEAKITAKREAQKVILSAIQRSAADHSAETTVSVVTLPNEEMKGRIIGREGRNIRSFELASGIQIVIDDTPEAVVLSGFDPLRREIAKMALEKLIADGRIHPGRIEEAVEKAKAEMEEIIVEAGEQALMELGINKVHSELIKLLGKLKYRTSYGQNVLKHSIEVAQLAGLMAAELDLDATLAKRAGLLHDIGKAIDKYTQGTHVQIGIELAKKYNEHPVVINAIASHHEDEPVISPISVLVQAADSISGSRPGARRETLESYIKRLVRLEEVATSFEGVVNSYAIQAGREIRVMVEPSEVDDIKSFKLAQDIAEKIEADMEYPGQIKVTVIRELRAIDYAK